MANLSSKLRKILSFQSPIQSVVGKNGMLPILKAQVLEHNIPSSVPQNTIQFAHISVINDSDKSWQQNSSKGNPIVLVMKIGGVVVGASSLPLSVIKPKEQVIFSFRWQALGSLGKVELTLEWVEQNVAYIGMLMELEIELKSSSTCEAEELMNTSFQHNPWFYLPSQGVSWSRHSSSRRYPLFVEKAKGSKFWDSDGNEFIDYVSGWGACLLGYSDTRVVSAVTHSLNSGSLTTLPNILEMKLTSQLCQWLPSAEMVTFGKNGSDVTTAAVRLARAYTNRPKIFYCGYHGWQDWNAESFGIPKTIPIHNPAIVGSFSCQNIEQLKTLFQKYPDQIAGIVLEPAAQVEGINGPIQPANANFLKAVAELCQSKGALLIFDEIFTGFRYLDGSVQQAVNVQPDLTCLGKALGAGMPLSALVGKRDIFQNAIGKIAYDATFKGEPHSFAAALAALSIYQQEPVVQKVWQFGERLMDGINQLCLELKIPAKMVGLPIRMILAFENTADAILMRTFIQQELLLQGVLCYRGLMIPSYAHSEEDLQLTLKAYRLAFESLNDSMMHGKLLKQIEIPLVI